MLRVFNSLLSLAFALVLSACGGFGGGGGGSGGDDGGGGGNNPLAHDEKFITGTTYLSNCLQDSFTLSYARISITFNATEFQKNELLFEDSNCSTLSSVIRAAGTYSMTGNSSAIAGGKKILLAATLTYYDHAFFTQTAVDDANGPIPYCGGGWTAGQFRNLNLCPNGPPTYFRAHVYVLNGNDLQLGDQYGAKDAQNYPTTLAPEVYHH